MDYAVIISLVTLIALEVVLGIDNVIFISIIASKLPAHKQKKARRNGALFVCALKSLIAASRRSAPGSSPPPGC